MNWNTVKLGQILLKSDQWVEIDPAEQYQQVTIKMWGQGLALRQEVFGSAIKAKRQLQVKEGQFILSRIDARNGAFGLVPKFLDGAVVSNDFPAFDLNLEQLFPPFLGWMSKTASFVDLCTACKRRYYEPCSIEGR